MELENITKDPATSYTKHGTPIIMVLSRGAFALFFLYTFYTIANRTFGEQTMGIPWFVYLVAMYGVCEYIYAVFLRQRINLSFAFPLIFVVYILNFISIIIRGQEDFPLINRAEHFASFVLIGFVIWTFFQQYLPQRVWRRHPYYTSLLVLSITSFIGVLNEQVELFVDVAFNTDYIGQGFDTALDLLMNTIGTGLFLAVRLILLAGNIFPIDGDK